MKKKYAIFLSVFCTSLSFSQVSNSVRFIESNGVKALVNGNGTLFTDKSNNRATFEYPNGSGNTTIYGSRLAFGGILPNGELSLSSSNDTLEFNTGPLSVQNSNSDYGPATIDSARSVYWDKVFHVRQSEISQFIDYTNCLNDPNCNEIASFPNYTIPNSILDWPAHGDTSFNEPYNLAPFSDVNNDGSYNPLDGDFPCIKGDEYLWCVYNNYLVDSSLSSGHGGVEIQMGIYAYASQNALNNSIFVDYKITNRSTVPLDDFYFASITDTDIGYSQDDYFASLPDKNAVFGYNGDNYDEGGMGMNGGYATNPPMQGMVFLNKASHASDEINIYLDSVNEQYNLFKGLNKDGSTKVFPGTSVVTQHTYPYLETNPYFWNEENFDGNGTINTPGDRRVFMSSGPYSFTPGLSVSLTMNFVCSQGFDFTGALSGLTNLLDDIDSIQNFYDEGIPNCSGGYLNTSLDLNSSAHSIELFPNPTQDQVNIRTTAKNEMQLELYSINGILLIRKSIITSAVINMEKYQSGVYLIKLTDQSGNIEVLKIIKE